MSTEVTPVKDMHNPSQKSVKAPSVDLAEEKLLEGKRQLEQQLAYIDEVLSSIRKVKQKQSSGLDSIPAVQDGQFRGKGPVAALAPRKAIRPRRADRSHLENRDT